MVPPSAADSALIGQQHVRQIRKRHQEEDKSSSVRVAAAKLDSLVKLVGELLTVQARLHQKASGEKDPELASISEEVQRLVAELRDNTMNIRMLPLDATLSRLRRLAWSAIFPLNREKTSNGSPKAAKLNWMKRASKNSPILSSILSATASTMESKLPNSVHSPERPVPLRGRSSRNPASGHHRTGWDPHGSRRGTSYRRASDGHQVAGQDVS